MQDDFETKLKKAHAEMDAAGIWPSNYNPPIYRLFRGLGLKVRPPHYQNVGLQALIMGVLFGFLFALISAIGEPTTFAELAFIAMLAGAIFGCVMAGLTFMRRMQTKLSKWEDL